MSGGSRSGYGGPIKSESPCDELEFETFLSSPDPEIIIRLGVGEILEVAIRTGEARRFIAVMYEGEVAGSIIQRVAELISCIKEGHSFVAEVISLEGGNVRLRVRPSS